MTRIKREKGDFHEDKFFPREKRWPEKRRNMKKKKTWNDGWFPTPTS